MPLSGRTLTSNHGCFWVLIFLLFNLKTKKRGQRFPMAGLSHCSSDLFHSRSEFYLVKFFYLKTFPFFFSVKCCFQGLSYDVHNLWDLRFVFLWWQITSINFWGFPFLIFFLNLVLPFCYWIRIDLHRRKRYYEIEMTNVHWALIILMDNLQALKKLLLIFFSPFFPLSVN